MQNADPRRLTHAVLAAGIALRIALGVAMPPGSAYDDHFEPIEIILTEGRIPSAATCWECFQPPLYYLLSAGVCSITERVARLGGADRQAIDGAQRKIVQLLSVVAGAAALYVCLLILRKTCRMSPAREALALAFIAFLPRHIYMSAMATNDALTYLLAALAVLATLDAHQHGFAPRRCLIAGALGGATILCKGYGLMTAAAILAAVGVCTYVSARHLIPRERDVKFIPLGLILAATIAVGIWPTVRNVVIYERMHVDNYDMYHTPMHTQPPGSVGETSFLSFRFLKLLQHPWLHVAHADSFWTELYARLWFDYEGFSTSLASHPPWQAHFAALRDRWERDRPGLDQWPRQRWESLLDYDEPHVPRNLGRVAVVTYVAAIPLTVCVLAGLGLSLRRFGRDVATTLLTLNLLLAICVPLFQTLRLPHFAAMKAAFALCGLSTIPVLVTIVLGALRPAALRFVIPMLWISLVVVALADAAYVLDRFFARAN